ncbi:MAG: class I SAM-dependent methyltransferase [Anaerolineae bacterium]|nr:class I SAM-dependent methyltransferase [Anaerolineae bacterium]
MSDETSITTNTYNQHAEHYAAHLGSSVLDAEQDRFAALLSAGAWVADVGSGPGHYAVELAARGLNVIPVDLSLGLLREGAQYGVPHCVQANMLRLPFGMGVLDGVWACASLLHLSRDLMPDALRELRRIVRIGGAAFIDVKLGTGEAWIPVDGAGSRFFTYYQPGELDALITAAGWQIVHAEVNPDAMRTNITWLARYCRAV